MSNNPLASAYSGSRIALLALLFTGFMLFAIVALPPGSRATKGLPQTSRSASGKRLRPEFVPGHVLVRYKDEATAERVEKTMTALSVKGSSIPIQIERFDAADMVAGLRLAHVDPEETMNAIEALKARRDVLYAEPDFIMHAHRTPNDPQFPSMYGLTKIGAPTAWDTTTGGGNNVVVGVIDEGIDVTHPDLQANIWVNPSPGSIPGFTGDINGWDFFHNDATVFDNTGGYKVPCNPGPPPGGNNCDETDSHATHVAGTIGAVGNNGVGVVGVNWSVRLMSLKFLGPTGGASSDALRAMNYAKAQKDLFVSSGGAQGANIRVLNNSYGGGGFTQAFLDGINAINQSGILFVASAGNDSTNNDTTPQYPAGYKAPNVIAVASTNSADTLSGFSNTGPQSVSLGAPGSSILSTTPTSTYDTYSGTSMASPQVAGSAALLLAQNPNLTVAQLKSLLIFNGDALASLSTTTFSGRRLNVASSLAALASNDTTAPGTVTNFHVNSQTGRSFDLGWTASGGNGATGQASLYQLSFSDAITGAVVQLRNLVPPVSGTPQTFTAKVPYGHTNGTITLREFDNVGNEGTPATLNVSISFLDGNPYGKIVGQAVPLSTGGTHMNFNCDDCYRNSTLPFSFPFFGQTYTSVTVSSNGNIYFTPPTPPQRSDPVENADDVPSSVGELTTFKMIAGLWDDLYLKTTQRADADVYVVQPDSSRIIFRWQGVPCNAGPAGSCLFGGSPINFEIELRSNGLIQTRYGSGNIGIFPVVGISGGEPDPYVIATYTSEETPISLTNAGQVSYVPHTSSGSNGAAKTGVFRPTTGELFLKNSNTTGFADINITFGNPGDYPLAGDWNGDGIDSVGIYRNGVFYLRNSNSTGFADIVVAFGSPGDQPVVGDWNGDGVDTIGIYRNGTFYLRNSNTPGEPDLVYTLGDPGDVAIAGDWNGDGVDTGGVFRPSNGIVYLRNSNTTGIADLSFVFGNAGDKPVAGDWNGDGVDSIGIYRGGTFYLSNSNATGFADIVFVLGNPGDFPIAGNWNGLP